MEQERIPVKVSYLMATVPEGVLFEWQGKEISSGPLFMELDDAPGERESYGTLDYSTRHAQVEFHVRLRFPEVARLLEDLGADPRLTEPVHAVVRSEGAILNDHSFALSGSTELRPHRVYSGEDASARVLPGR